MPHGSRDLDAELRSLKERDDRFQGAISRLRPRWQRAVIAQAGRPVAPDANPQLRMLVRTLEPHVVEFGELILGERLPWSIKELWVNVLETGGRQALHNHANSFISGVLYLTDSDPSANTMFVKAAGSGASKWRRSPSG